MGWLDRYIVREVDTIKQEKKNSTGGLYINIKLPKLDHSVVYAEVGAKGVPDLSPSRKEQSLSQYTYTRFQCKSSCSDAGDFLLTGGGLTMLDPEIMLTGNLVEHKHNKLTRGRQHGADRDLKPNPAMRDQLVGIVERPPTAEMSPVEKDLLWRFRFYLCRSVPMDSPTWSLLLF